MATRNSAGRSVAAVNPYDVTIFEAGGQVKVRPGTVRLPLDDTLHIINLCAEDAVVMFPRGLLDPLIAVTVPIGSNRGEAVTVRREPGVYEYAVLAQGPGRSRLGEGESGPRIIIE